MNCLRIYNISIDSSRKILVFQTYPSTRPFRHIRAFFYLSFPAFFSYCHSRAFFFIVIPRLGRGIYKIQGTVLRYVHKKQRVSTKVRAAAGNAVKPATACHVRAFSYLCHVQTCPEHLPRCHPRVQPASDVIPRLNPPLVSSLVYPVSDVIPGFNLPLVSSPGSTRGSSGFPRQNRK